MSAALQHELMRVPPGDVLEVGVYRGASLLQICRTIKELGHRRHVVGVDTFEGLPRPDIEDGPAAQRLTGAFRCEQWFVRARLLRHGFYPRLVRGRIEEVARWLNVGIALGHIDCDLYSGYAASLAFIWPRLVPGGSIVLDDYRTGDVFNGPALAVERFDKAEPVLVGDRYVLRKP